MKQKCFLLKPKPTETLKFGVTKKRDYFPLLQPCIYYIGQISKSSIQKKLTYPTVDNGSPIVAPSDVGKGFLDSFTQSSGNTFSSYSKLLGINCSVSSYSLYSHYCLQHQDNSTEQVVAVITFAVEYWYEGFVPCHIPFYAKLTNIVLRKTKEGKRMLVWHTTFYIHGMERSNVTIH